MKTESKKSEYDIQAEEFLNKTNTKIIVRFSHTGKHFDGSQFRDIYSITIKNKKHSFTFDFGQSIGNYGKYKIFASTRGNQSFYQIGFYHVVGINFPQISYGLQKTSLVIFEENSLYDRVFTPILRKSDRYEYFAEKNPDFSKPSSYSVLACLTKYDTGSFGNFCSEYDYNTDSIKALKIYQAVQNEWDNVKRLWTPEEIELLGEIL